MEVQQVVLLPYRSKVPYLKLSFDYRVCMFFLCASGFPLGSLISRHLSKHANGLTGYTEMYPISCLVFPGEALGPPQP